MSGTMTIYNSTVSGNRSAHFIGGILNGTGSLTIVNSTVSGNNGTLIGGGIGGSATLINSVVSGNQAASGGGISGSVTLYNSSVTGNSAGTLGGGIYNGNSSVIISVASSVKKNTPDQIAPSPEPRAITP